MKIFVNKLLCFGMLLLVMQPLSVAAAERNVLKEAQVRQVVTDYLREKTGRVGADIQLKKINFSGEIPLPPGVMSFELLSPQEWEGWGRGSLALIVRVNDQLVKNIPLNVEVAVMADMVVTMRPLEKGEVLAADDVSIQRRDMATAPARACRSIDEVLGKRVRVGLRGNSPVRGDYLERLPIVKSGQMVTIVAENSAFRVTAAGRSKGNGAEGDTIMVQNLNAHKEMPAVVVNATTVRVEF